MLACALIVYTGRMSIEELWQLRDQLGISRAQLAREIGVNQATLWRWETGKFNPTPLAEKQVERVLQRLRRRATGRGASEPEGEG